MADRVTVRYVSNEENHAGAPDVIDLGNGVVLVRDGSAVEMDAAEYERIAARDFGGARLDVVRGKQAAAEAEKKASERMPQPDETAPREINPLNS
jgi:hypothetical protein